MGRGLTTDTVNALSAQRVLPAVFLYASFLDGEVRVWNGIGNISWLGHTWLGLGQAGGECLGSISAMSEDSSVTAQGVTISLCGVDPTMLGHALTAVQQGLPCRIWVNLFNDDLEMIGTVLTYGGLIDQPTIQEGANGCTIAISVESRLSDLQRAQTRRWTDQEQRQRHPADTGFSFVNTLQLWAAAWGAE
jgi:hypothetical protein